jgi:tRNA threonylcarbamoyl adenosine modification protein YeaZ
MRVLAIDTSLEACSAAVLDTEHGDILASETRPMVRGHAEAVAPLIAAIVQTARLNYSAMDRVAVTTGPGSFTGLRVGLSAARGIGLAAGKPVVGVTTLAAFAAPHIAHDDRIAVAAVIDARHGLVYFQLFGAQGRTIIAPRIIGAEEAALAARQAGARIVGTAARLVAGHWPPDVSPPLVDEQRAPDVEWVARLGAAATESKFPPKPLYLRAPDAQPQDAAQLPRR